MTLETRHIAYLLLPFLISLSQPIPATARTEPLWLSPAKIERGQGGRPEQAHHAGQHDEGASQSGKPASSRRPAATSGRPSSGEHASHGGNSSRFESEHRPLPIRAYKLNTDKPLLDASAKVLYADGTSADLEAELCHSNIIKLQTPMGEGPMHGPNNIYVIDKQVHDGILEIRTAKWLSIHHSCGWGHDYRNDPDRLTPRPLPSAPLDIVMEGLWDGNFHNALHSGDELVIRVYSFGKPAPGATVRITTEKGWTAEKQADAEGTVRIQLIRDYYPPTWKLFNRSTLGRLALTAEYIEEGSFQYKDESIDKTHYLTSFSWKYVPAQADYNSYLYGLLIGTLAFLGSGFGVYHYRLRRKKPQQVIVFDE